LIKNNSKQKNAKTESLNCTDEEIDGSTLFFICSCGAKILIVPDLAEISKAVQIHMAEHKKLCGQILTEDDLTQEILSFIIKSINEG